MAASAASASSSTSTSSTKSQSASASHASLFPSPSSGFVVPPALPTDDDTSIQRILSSASSRRSSTTIRRNSIHDKENAGPISRTSSTASVKRLQSQAISSDEELDGRSTPGSSSKCAATPIKARRRSSAAHPLSPATAARRSRPNSMSFLGSSATASPPTSNLTQSQSHPPSTSASYSNLASPSSRQQPPIQECNHRLAFAESRRNSGYSATSSVEPASAAESPLPTTSDLPPAESEPSESEAGRYKRDAEEREKRIRDAFEKRRSSAGAHSNSAGARRKSNGSGSAPHGVFGKLSASPPSKKGDKDRSRVEESEASDSIYTRQHVLSTSPPHPQHHRSGHSPDRNQHRPDGTSHGGRSRTNSASVPQLSSSRSAATLRPGKKTSQDTQPGDGNDGAFDASNEDGLEDDDNEQTPMPLFERVVIIRDFAFPAPDPRYKGLPAPSDPINIPYDAGAGSSSHSWYNYSNASSAVLSSSSSSSLSSSFTPPPFGSFGFGNPYHVDHRARQQGQQHPSHLSPPQPHHNHSHRQAQPSGDWSRWNGDNRADIPYLSSEDDRGRASKPSKYHWNFVTEQDGQPSSSGDMSPFTASRSAGGGDDALMPSALLGSALSIDDFDDEEEDEEDDEENDIHMDFESMSPRDPLPSGSSAGHMSTSNSSAGTASAAPGDNNASSSIPLAGHLYKAAYAFTAEAPQEMSLVQGDLVRVWEQLCDGWVVGGKVVQDRESFEEEEVETGLIPQNYLIRVQESQ